MCTVLAFAHSGRTDGDGGHYDSATGEYHYHHGYPAHQHEDGICPYNFDDKTGQISGGSGESESGTGRETPAAVQEQSRERSIWKDYVLPAVSIFLFTPVGVMTLEAISAYREKKNGHRKRDGQPSGRQQGNPHPTQSKRGDAKGNRQQDQAAKAAAYREQYEGRSIWEMAEVPEGAYFDCQNLPHTLDCGGEPDLFIVYVTEKGKCYHKPGCRLAASGTPVNLCIAIQRGKCACKSCRPMKQVPDFVKRYQHIKRIQSKYGIDMLP